MPSKRERYESANIRGGMGVRKRLSEESFRPTYRLNGVQRGATIAACLDRFGRWEGGYRLGTLVRKTAHWVYVKWDDEEEVAMIDQGDARYAVDRGRWRILAPRIGDPLGGERGIALTTLAENARIQASANADTPPTEENDEDMAREQSNAARERGEAQKAVANGELKERETYTAKQVAYRCGTDAKTMRKFFRSKASTVEPVGQGGRYEFQATDMPKIKSEFDAWRKKADSRATASKPAPEKLVVKATPKGDVVSAQFVPTDGDHDRPTPKSSMSMDELADAIERIQDEEDPTPEQIKELEQMEEARDFYADGEPDLLDDDIEEL